MKKRNGFVSNSSSSSFICDECAEAVELDNYDIVSCKNGHQYCWGCTERRFGQEPSDVNDRIDGVLSEEECPLCNFEELAYSDRQIILNQLLKNIDMNATTIKKLFKNTVDLRQNFQKLEPFDDIIKLEVVLQDNISKNNTKKGLNLRG